MGWLEMVAAILEELQGIEDARGPGGEIQKLHDEVGRVVIGLARFVNR